MNKIWKLIKTIGLMLIFRCCRHCLYRAVHIHFSIASKSRPEAALFEFSWPSKFLLVENLCEVKALTIIACF